MDLLYIQTYIEKYAAQRGLVDWRFEIHEEPLAAIRKYLGEKHGDCDLYYAYSESFLASKYTIIVFNKEHQWKDGELEHTIRHEIEHVLHVDIGLLEAILKLEKYAHKYDNNIGIYIVAIEEALERLCDRTKD